MRKWAMIVTSAFLVSIASVDAHGDEAQTQIRAEMLALLENRDAVEGATFRAIYVETTEGPAHFFTAGLRAGMTGRDFRQEHVQIWWARGDDRATTVAWPTTVWLDGEIAFQETKEQPLHTTGIEGGQVYHVTWLGTPLVRLNRPWPYHNTEQPVMFGHAYNRKDYTQLIKEAVGFGEIEVVNDEPCRMVEVASSESTTLHVWLALNKGGMAVREEFRREGTLRITRDFRIDQVEGVWYTHWAEQTHHTSTGERIRKTWSCEKFEVIREPVEGVFSPKLDDFSFVVDDATGVWIKGDLEAYELSNRE